MLESPLDFREIKPVSPKGNQSWLFIGRTDAEAETPILWPPDVKNWLLGKDPDAGKDWRQEEKGMTEGEIVGWHNRLNGHEFEQALGADDGQGSLTCCSPWGHKESDTTEWLNWTEWLYILLFASQCSDSVQVVKKKSPLKLAREATKHSGCFQNNGYNTRTYWICHDALMNRKNWTGCMCREFVKALKRRYSGLRRVACFKVGSPQLCLLFQGCP